MSSALRASWLPKITNGWFFRAESFFSVARYLDAVGSPYANFLSYSHGEGFMRFFEERCQKQGIFIFDEPESALSPARQIEFDPVQGLGGDRWRRHHIRDSGGAIAGQLVFAACVIGAVETERDRRAKEWDEREKELRERDSLRAAAVKSPPDDRTL